MSKRSTVKNRISEGSSLTFLVFPLSVFTLWPNILDSGGIPRLAAFCFGALLLIGTVKIRHSLSFFIIPPILLNVTYLVSQILKPNQIDRFLIGSYGRNGGFIFSVIICILFIWLSMSQHDLHKKFLKVFTTTYFLLILFGYMQYFNLVPFQTSLQFNALSLTLGNPNFASALMGVMISGHITYIYIDKSKRNYISWAILSSAMFQLYLIKSLQGFLVVLFSLLIILVRHKRDLISSISLTKKILISILILTLLYFILFKTTLAQWIYINGSVRNRLSYWELSFNIFRDNFLLGVGIDNLRNYALAYRDLSLTLQEGVFTIPDRSHNVAIDHFVNGGIVAGILWLVFIVSVSYLAIRLINYDPEIEKTYLIIVIIWFGYLIQSLISVDHLSLTSLAFITSGLMIHKWLTLKKLEKGLSKRFFTYTFLARVLSLTLGISSIFLILMFMPNEIRAGKLYYEGKLQVVNELLGNMRIQSQTLEKIMVDMSQKKRFDLANSFAEKLLIASPNSHQAYYVKSVYSESIGDDDLGKEFMLKAHKIDQWNPVYLLSLSIYEYKLGNISKAIEYFLRTEKINPNQQGLETVRKLLF